MRFVLCTFFVALLCIKLCFLNFWKEVVFRVASQRSELPLLLFLHSAKNYGNLVLRFLSSITPLLSGHFLSFLKWAKWLPKGNSCPNFWNLCMLPYGKKKKRTLQVWLRILRWINYPALSKWALTTYNSKCLYNREVDGNHRTIRGEGNVTTEKDIGVTWP